MISVVRWLGVAVERAVSGSRVDRRFSIGRMPMESISRALDESRVRSGAVTGNPKEVLSRCTGGRPVLDDGVDDARVGLSGP
jgi:hypothetical protein